MDIFPIMSDTLTYPHQPDPSQDYGENDRIDSDCAVCGQVWLVEDIDRNGLCPCCRPEEELNQADEDWWEGMTRGCEKFHEQKENN